jgi:hypothetical protein
VTLLLSRSKDSWRSAIGSFARDLRRQQSAHVAHHDPRLPTIGRNDHHRPALAGAEVFAIAAEAGQIDGDQRHREALCRHGR